MDKIALTETLTRRCVVDFSTGCWVWTGCMMKNGYGKLGHYDKTYLTHRVSYIIHHGDIPDGLQIDHLCRNRACCNPDHLEAVTCRENLVRGMGFSGLNARKTECIHGHPLEGSNLYIHKKTGDRVCRACHAAREAKRRHRIQSGSLGLPGLGL